MAAQAPAMGAAERVPAAVPEAYRPPGQSSYQKNWRDRSSRLR
jgi:hypothetical protein